MVQVASVVRIRRIGEASVVCIARAGEVLPGTATHAVATLRSR